MTDIDWRRVAVQLAMHGADYGGLTTPERDALEEEVDAAREADWGTSWERVADAADRGSA